MLFLLNKNPTKDQFQKACEEFGDYIKFNLDLESNSFTIGGQLHADGEKLLLDNGSQQENIWGGGYDLLIKQFDCNSLINTRPGNPSQEILDPQLRERFFKLCQKILPNKI
jgi:hypothetical protein